MRDVLLKRVRPMVERLATGLVDVAVARIEAELGRLTEALEIALSAYADEPPAPVPIVIERDPKPDNVVPRPVAIHVARAEPTAKPRDTGFAPQKTCSKCGYVGGNARGCGTAHATVVLASEPVGWASYSVDAVAPAAKSDPFAADKKDRASRIAARAAAAPRDVAQRMPDADDGDDEHQWSKERIAVEAARAESRKLGGELPIPRSSWDL